MTSRRRKCRQETCHPLLPRKVMPVGGKDALEKEQIQRRKEEAMPGAVPWGLASPLDAGFLYTQHKDV